jgi:hypothetical protein
VAVPLKSLQGECVGCPFEPVHGQASVAMQDMIKGLVCPLGARQASIGG